MADYLERLRYLAKPDLKNCIFCGAPSPLNSEHIFPRWSHRYLPDQRPMPNLIPRWKFSAPDRGSLFRIWPRTETSIVWRGRPMIDLDASYTANAFMNFVLDIQKREGVRRY